MTTRAIVIKAAGDAQVVETSIPKLRDDYLIVKVKAVAINPTDVAHIDYFASPGARVGCDYAGTVEEVGSKVTRDFKKGDRVAGVVHGSNAVNHEDGAFAELITAKGDLQIRIPDDMSFEDAATLGVGITTVGQALYQSLDLPHPDEPAKEKFPVLIYGGSTATGALAIQFAKLSGLEVITTVSPHNFAYVKELGADYVFDYNSETCMKDIREKAGGSLKYVLDCISKENTAKICVGAMSSDGGVYSTLLPVPPEVVAAVNSNVTMKFTLAYSAIGEDFHFGQLIPANPDDFKFARDFWTLAERLLVEGKVIPHTASLNEGGSGLGGVLAGLQLLREGKLSGRKMVYVV